MVFAGEELGIAQKTRCIARSGPNCNGIFAYGDGQRKPSRFNILALIKAIMSPP